ncbi:MAG: hypothetical protein AB1540_10855 [Bdellovibrionota bacterium]
MIGLAAITMAANFSALFELREIGTALHLASFSEHLDHDSDEHEADHDHHHNDTDGATQHSHTHKHSPDGETHEHTHVDPGFFATTTGWVDAAPNQIVKAIINWSQKLPTALNEKIPASALVLLVFRPPIV